ncbi:hypothetical protein DSCA_60110 [Desulfosarcina alkanivorans]|uniref:Uncharacterized protein n=1 Tax=Desulfosarcina alkanivorans TaxID=571177 RepID=A0A5K7YY72_9BACT|nr:hypothetical protein [Desulfosarcina alkanivorans]BBO72081.1 hypothetical protein DSCA_60110 [Desulfosarcina alkanivorans]
MAIKKGAQNCPLCNSEANSGPSISVSDQYKCFQCEICKAFVAQLTAEEILFTMPREQRLEYSKKSIDAKEGTVLVIYFKRDGSSKIPKAVYESKEKWFGRDKF